MNLKTARILAAAYHILMLYFVTWPGLLPFAKAEPLVFGLPFTMAWIAACISGSVVCLILLDTVEKRYRTKDGADD